jgi:hypothetical protein
MLFSGASLKVLQYSAPVFSHTTAMTQHAQRLIPCIIDTILNEVRMAFQNYISKILSNGVTIYLTSDA